VFACCIVLAVGSDPNTRWLKESGLVLRGGVLCESTCHAVGATDVMAAGDVACWPNLRFDAVPRRVEHWLNAIEMGRAPAANLRAGRGKAETFAPLPQFWSEQRLMVDGGERESVGVYARNGSAVGMVGLGRPRMVFTLTARLADTMRPRPRPRAVSEPA
jgi:NADH dehydrogenase FAD-containing subunit